VKTTTTCTQCGSAIPESPLNHPDYGPALCVRCRYATRQEKIVHGILSEFDVAAATVAAPETEPEGESNPMRELFRHKIIEFLEWLKPDPRKRHAAIEHFRGMTGCTDAEMARRLNISPGRFSQMRGEFRSKFGNFGLCNNRVRPKN
jgi:hypothetical protein